MANTAVLPQQDTHPRTRPHNPNFSSGPCAKRPGWSLDALSGALLARSHRAAGPKARLAEVIERSRAILGMPADWRLGIVPGSDTGAIEMAHLDPARRPPGRRPRLRELLRGLGHRRRQAAQAAERPHPQRPLRPAPRPRASSTRPATSSSPGTAPPPASACPMATSSPRTAKAWSSATPPPPPSPWTCPGTSSMSSPGPGRKCSAARPRTACWRSRPAPSPASKPTSRPGRCPKSSA